MEEYVNLEEDKLKKLEELKKKELEKLEILDKKYWELSKLM